MNRMRENKLAGVSRLFLTSFGLGLATIAGAEPPLDYTTSWLGNTHQPAADDADQHLYVHGWTTDLAVGSNGVVYTAGGSETGGKKAFRYNPATGRVEIVARYTTRGGVGNPSSSAAAVDDRYFYWDASGRGLLRSPLKPEDGRYEVWVRRNGETYFEDVGPPIAPEGDGTSVRWTGTITIPEEGEYQIGLLHHDGARLWLDGEMVVEDWRPIWRIRHFAPKQHYKAGQTVDVRIEYFATRAKHTLLELQWQRPDGLMITVPADALTTPDGQPGLKAEYFSDKQLTDLALTRVDRYVALSSPKTTNYSGLAVRDGRLYAADASRGRICVFDTQSLQLLGAWPLGFRPGQIALDRSPGGPYLWVAAPSAGKVHSYTLEGEKRSHAIEGIAYPGPIEVDRQNRLWVGDKGPDNWFLIHDISAAPRVVDTFGVRGGVWSEPSGKMGPLRFRDPVGVDFDEQGRIYVALDFALRGAGNTHIECYDADGARLWQAYADVYVDNAVLDPTDENVAYTSRQRFRVDWSRPWGREFTLDRLTFQKDHLHDRSDPRYQGFFLPYQSAVIDGEKFFYATHQKGQPGAWVYREDRGELVPAAWLTAATSGSFKYTPGGKVTPVANPLGHATWGAMIWRDLDGDGRFVHDDNTYPEQEFNLFIKGFAAATATVDATGAFWFIRGNDAERRNADPDRKDQRVLGRILPRGLSDSRAPNYETPYEDLTDKLPAFHSIEGIEYDPANAVMYFMARESDDALHLYRYDEFPNAPRLAWKSPQLPWNDKSFTPNTGYGAGQPQIPKAAGDYVFVTYGYGGWTRIYDARDGLYVGTLKPNTIASNRQGEVDSKHPMVAYQLSSGEYVIFVQSSGKHRVTVYRWNP